MKKIILIVLSVILLASCQEKNKYHVVKGQIEKVVIEGDCETVTEFNNRQTQVPLLAITLKMKYIYEERSCVNYNMIEPGLDGYSCFIKIKDLKIFAINGENKKQLDNNQLIYLGTEGDNLCGEDNKRTMNDIITLIENNMWYEKGLVKEKRLLFKPTNGSFDLSDSILQVEITF